MATKQWDSGYQDLLDIMNVPSLADHRLKHKLSSLYRIVHGMCYSPQISSVLIVIIVIELTTPL